VNEVIRAAAALQAVCLAEGWRFCFIGGLAVQRWGEPRETVDVDLTLLTGFDGEARFVSLLIERSEPRIDHAAGRSWILDGPPLSYRVARDRPMDRRRIENLGIR
jgi:hypothetical protein